MSDNTHFFDCSKAIYDRLVANWTTLPVIMDNDDGKSISKTSGFVRLVIDFMDSDFATINASNPLVRTVGAITIEVFTLQNRGVGLGDTYASQIATVFRGKSFSNVVCYAPTIATRRQIDYSTGKYWMTPLICPFKYDKHVTI